MDFFENVELLPPDPIFGLSSAFQSDPKKNKVNLGAGVYKTADLKPLILTTVKKAEKILLEKESSKDYVPIDGEAEYIEKTMQLVFGETIPLENVYGAQSLGGTGALRIGAQFLKDQGNNYAYVSDPTWENHSRIFQQAECEVGSYPYYDYKANSVDFKNLLNFLDQRITQKSILVLHSSCHNPTGCDLTNDQWKEMQEVLTKKEIFPFFDFAYQGFGNNLEQDAAAIRLFAEKGMQFAVAVSQAKNFGLYAERPGALFLVCSDPAQVKKVGSQVKNLIRGFYSNPPCHGTRIVTTILGDEDLKKHWVSELKAMRERIEEMRKAFIAKLHVKVPKVSFDFMSSQKGMFSFTGLSDTQVERLVKEFSIYIPKNGRINVAGLNTENMDYVTDAIAAVI